MWSFWDGDGHVGQAVEIDADGRALAGRLWRCGGAQVGHALSCFGECVFDTVVVDGGCDVCKQRITGGRRDVTLDELRGPAPIRGRLNW